jgi:hypothetical protein
MEFYYINQLRLFVQYSIELKSKFAGFEKETAGSFFAKKKPAKLHDTCRFC